LQFLEKKAEWKETFHESLYYLNNCINFFLKAYVAGGKRKRRRERKIKEWERERG
jgi:hypothetical protein